MATKKTTKKANTKKKVEGVDYKINENVTLTCYEWDDGCSAKLTLAGSFVIFARILENEDGEYFLSYPSYKTKKGEYKRNAYCFDKKIIAEINEDIEDFMSE